MLTAAQLDARKGKLTASRIACLMTGDAPAIYQLYLEFIGEAQPEDMSQIWPVRLGEATEALNLEWYQRNGNKLSRCGEVAVHPTVTWAAATLDGWDETLNCPVECKHVGGREPLEVVIDRYQPQMQWQMFVTGAEQCALSVIMGANAPIVEFIPRDDEYIMEMVGRGKKFMDCVAKRQPPVMLEAAPPPIDATKIYDMEENEQWRQRAQQWIQVKGAADTAKECEKILKSLVPTDAKRCHGHDIQITRDRAGRLSLRELQQ